MVLRTAKGLLSISASVYSENWFKYFGIPPAYENKLWFLLKLSSESIDITPGGQVAARFFSGERIENM